MERCPCNSGINYENCCMPIIKGETKAETAEVLMRARYTSFTKHELDFIKATIHPKQIADYDEKGTRDWAYGSEWIGLEIVSTEKGLSCDEEGIVEFKAKFKQQNYDLEHHEKAEFKKVDGQWFFYNGVNVPKVPVVREEPKIGRNEPCICGSGKKYKKCCGK